MTQTFQKSFKFDRKAESLIYEKANLLRRRWIRLCETFLPVKNEDSLWRFNRETKTEEPTQGWKLHISATILEACDVFEKVAPFLIDSDVQFKAPDSLNELVKINSGLQYGYHQVGKFITIYPSTTEKAVELAAELHKLTCGFHGIAVPFDERFLPGSSVFYRYGAFRSIEIIDRNGEKIPVIKNSQGAFIFDDREKAVPEWLSDPFQNIRSDRVKINSGNNPLVTKYRIFRAVTQRGKGGTYQAIDLSEDELRLCIVKEGRKNGEIGWNGHDGFFLVCNEFNVLRDLSKKYSAVPQVYSSFQVRDNFYLAMEYIEGKSLQDIMNRRRRRFSNKQIIEFAVRIAQIIENIHKAGWVWNDCKPANLIVTKDKKLRPIDFEASFPADQADPFDWKTKEFSKPNLKTLSDSNSKSADIYAFGAVLYYLVTGILFDHSKGLTIKKMRTSTPISLISLVEKLLFTYICDISEIRKEIEKISESVNRV